MTTPRRSTLLSLLLIGLLAAACGGQETNSPKNDTLQSDAVNDDAGRDTSSPSDTQTDADDDTADPGDTTTQDTTPPADTIDPVTPQGPPSVVEFSPKDGAIDVSIISTLQITFDVPVNPDSLDLDAVTISPPISGSFFWDPQALLATFRPNVYWQKETLYQVTLTPSTTNPSITSPEGAPLTSEVSFSFTTGADILPAGDTSTYNAKGESAQVQVSNADTTTRTYTLSTTLQLRDNEPSSGEVTFSEEPGQPILRSGHHLFDALFAMAIEETRQNSVSSISDYAFNTGAGVDCDCFETGAKWNYVWTRDTAYAVDLGLPWVDPQRAMNSLNFKLSERKGGGDLQIVQDTGTGGSYPVSSDRVVWALGAWEVLKFLEGPERETFRDRVYEALTNTITQDRWMVLDPNDGLYHGEQSFLDWREQSYPSWTAGDLVPIASSASLSTNAAHHITLRVAAALADEKGEADAAANYRRWMDDLSAAMHDELWLQDEGMFSALTIGPLDSAALHKFDLLGLTLSILEGIASPAEASQILAAYPHSAVGPPVLWPQQPQIPIYHNRGIWPFVTAYTVLAARKSHNSAVFNHDLSSLIQGAALNLSNMENFEFLTLGNWVDDGAFSGPVVNSRRQLWSVAGYLGAIIKGVFGVEATQSGLQIQPFITPWLHDAFFKNSDRITLDQLRYRGHQLRVEIILPPLNGANGEAYRVEALYLNGVRLESDNILAADLGVGSVNIITVELGAPSGPDSVVNIVNDAGDFRDFWAPLEPNLGAIQEVSGGLELSFDSAGESGVVFNVYRDGVVVAEGVAGPTWTDTDTSNRADHTYCYAVESVFPTSGNRSHRSRPDCFWGVSHERIQEWSAYDMEASAGVWSWTAGRPYRSDWGRPEDTLTISHLTPHWSGTQLIQLSYSNGSGPISTGITAAVKTLTLTQISTGEVIAEGPIVMPHLDTWDRWEDSTSLAVYLDANESYELVISDGLNMSYFEHFVPYTALPGGGNDSHNFVHIAGLKLLPITGSDLTPSTGSLIPLDGSGDVGRFSGAQQMTPGAALGGDDLWAFDWDEDFLYVALRSDAFGSDYVPFMLYLEATSGLPGAPVAGSGFEYSDLASSLPFAPTHMVSVRQLSDDGSAGGPWSGVWRKEGGSWTQDMRFAPGESVWLSADHRTISFRVPRATLGGADYLRLAGHVVNAQPANEWKDLVPSDHTPWEVSGGGYYEVDLNGAKEISAWDHL